MKTIVSVLIVVLLSAVSGSAAPLKSTPHPPKEMPSPAANAGVEETLSGKVIETMNAGGYTYVRIDNRGKKIWVAVPETKVAVGQQVAFQPGQEMRGFTSKTLNRTFDSIIFSGGLSSGAAGRKFTSATHAGSKAAVVKSAEKISVEKAQGPNAYTIGEIFAQRGKLNKKTVVVKAKVVKVSTGIMGKNWIHLQDGTGDAAKGTNNLVATSQDQPSVGDVVTMKGTLYKDKDFGAGYKYTAIIEQAGIQR